MKKSLPILALLFVIFIGCSTVPKEFTQQDLDQSPLANVDYQDFRRMFFSQEELQSRINKQVCELVVEESPARGGQVKVGTGLPLEEVLDYPFGRGWTEQFRIIVISERTILQRPQYPNNLTESEKKSFDQLIINPGDIVYVNLRHCW